MDPQDLVYRLKKRAEIRREIKTRKSVINGEPDRIADLLEEAAAELEHLRKWKAIWKEKAKRLRYKDLVASKLASDTMKRQHEEIKMLREKASGQT